MEELVSIIVPIYKVEQYLRECVESILDNTYRNLEVILIDDGSPDHCGEICDEYAKKDSRIKVIHQDNKGLVGARNTGIAVAKGEYLGFVDSDDVVSPVLYETLVKLMEEENADAVGCEYSSRQQDLEKKITPVPELHTWNTFEEMLALITTAPEVRNLSWTGPYVWNKLYRRRYVNVLYRPECLMCEDLRYNYDYIANCRKFVTARKILYYYRTNEAGICGDYRHNFRNKLMHGIRNSELWEEISNNPVKNEKLKSYLQARAAYMTHGALWRIYFSGEAGTYRHFVNNAHRLIHDHFEDVWTESDSYTLRVRLIIAFYRFARPLWCACARMFGLLDEMITKK